MRNVGLVLPVETRWLTYFYMAESFLNNLEKIQNAVENCNSEEIQNMLETELLPNQSNFEAYVHIFKRFSISIKLLEV